MIPIVVLAVNAFWWLPGIWLASTKGESDFAFAHPEGVMRRLLADLSAAEVADSEPSCWRRACRDCSCSGGAVGCRAGRLIGFCAAGMFWGYLAGARGHSISCSRAGIPMRSIQRWRSPAARDSTSCCRRLRVGPHGADHLDRWVMAGAS